MSQSSKFIVATLFSICLASRCFAGDGPDCSSAKPDRLSFPAGLVGEVSWGKHLENVNHGCSIFPEIANHPPLLNGRISSKWTQEYTGADLALSFMSDWSKQHTLASTHVGILENISSDMPTGFSEDSGSSTGMSRGRPDFFYRRANVIGTTGAPLQQNALNHGTEVRGYIEGKSGFGTAFSNAITGFFPGNKEQDFLHSFQEGLNRTPIDVVNSSNRFDVNPFLAAIGNRNTVFVTSAGNTFWNGDESLGNNKDDPRDNLIVVGAASALGYPSYYSNEGGGVTLLAPVDNEALSYDLKGNIVRGEGTSFASPQVAGVVSNIRAFLPNASAAQIKQILTQTAIQLPTSSQTPPKNGAGMLNAFLAVKTAARIASQCGNPSPSNCIIKSLQDGRISDFSSESSAILAANHLLDKNSLLEQAYPVCFHKNQKPIPNQSCTDIRSAVNTLRQALFLSPDNKEAWRTLSCISNSESYSVNAAYYEQLSDPTTITAKPLAPGAPRNPIEAGMDISIFLAALRNSPKDQDLLRYFACKAPADFDISQDEMTMQRFQATDRIMDLLKKRTGKIPSCQN